MPLVDDFANRLPREITTWVDEGLITEGQAQEILERYDTSTHAPRKGEGWASSLLYGTASVLLGAAAIAFVLVGLEPSPAAPWLFGLGLGLAAFGGLAHIVFEDRALLGDALLAAALFPLAGAVIDTGEVAQAWWFAAATVALGTVYLGVRYRGPFLSVLAVIGISVALGAAAFTGSFFTPEEDALTAWMLAQVLLLGAVIGVDRFRRVDPQAGPTAWALAALWVSLILFFWDIVGLETEGMLLAVGAILTALLVGGSYASDRGLMLGAGACLGIVAVWFAFAVGGIVLGTGLLIALAAMLIWQAEHLRGFLET